MHQSVQPLKIDSSLQSAIIRRLSRTPLQVLSPEGDFSRPETPIDLHCLEGAVLHKRRRNTDFAGEEEIMGRQECRLASGESKSMNGNPALQTEAAIFSPPGRRRKFRPSLGVNGEGEYFPQLLERLIEIPASLEGKIIDAAAALSFKKRRVDPQSAKRCFLLAIIGLGQQIEWRVPGIFLAPMDNAEAIGPALGPDG
jgi:hypothetical protein